MTHPHYEELIQQMLSDNPAKRLVARMILLATEEKAVPSLSDAYYAGVTDDAGSVLLDLLAEIGGYEALALLYDVFESEAARPALKQAAAHGLLRNADNLSQMLREQVALFIAGIG